MTVTTSPTDVAVAQGFDRRVAPMHRLRDDAAAVARACRDMAARFHRGGRLLVFGNGASATDAQHVAVEFVHPVIVGKRALPSLSLVSDVATVMGLARRHGIDDVFAHQVSVLGRPTDIALGLSGDGDCPNVARGLRTAREAGLLTVALVGGDGGAIARDRIAEHCIVVGGDDPRVVKEGHVTAYHLLWELVHVFFDHPEALDDAPPQPAQDGGVEALYPFLYGGTGVPDAVLEQVAASTREKITDVVALRRSVGAEQAETLAACARTLALAFAAGGTVLAFGNGGSSTDAQDVAHTFLAAPDGAVSLPALCLTNDAAVVTALSNDIGFDVVFARQVRAFGRPGDIAVGVSTSGGSPNVLAGLGEAKRMGMVTVGFAGYGGGRMAEMDGLDYLFAVPSSSVHRVQEVQTTLYHVLWEATQRALSGAAARPGPAHPPPPPARG